MLVSLKAAGTGLRLLVVAEDWCSDSVNTVPYLATLATRAGVEQAAAMVQKYGGGTGFSFSQLRGAGEAIATKNTPGMMTRYPAARQVCGRVTSAASLTL